MAVCRKCGSTSTSFIPRGFSGLTGIICCLFLGPIGLLFGFIGSGKQVPVCNDCGSNNIDIN